MLRCNKLVVELLEVCRKHWPDEASKAPVGPASLACAAIPNHAPTGFDSFWVAPRGHKPSTHPTVNSGKSWASQEGLAEFFCWQDQREHGAVVELQWSAWLSLHYGVLLTPAPKTFSKLAPHNSAALQGAKRQDGPCQNHHERSSKARPWNCWASPGLTTCSTSCPGSTA